MFSTLQYHRSGDSRVPYDVPFTATGPALAEMASAALNVLGRDEDGFCLAVESGAVDWAGHANNSVRLIEEELEFNRAVDAVVKWVRRHSNWRDTVVIVTGDHETGYLTGSDSDEKPGGPVWSPLVSHGKGRLPGMEWHSTAHTNALIPFFARGRAASYFSYAATNVDPVRGRYLDNTTIGRIALLILGAPYSS